MAEHQPTDRHATEPAEEDAVTALRSLPSWARHPLTVTLACVLAGGALFAAGRSIGALAAREGAVLPIVAAVIVVCVAVIALGVRLDRRRGP